MRAARWRRLTRRGAIATGRGRPPCEGAVRRDRFAAVARICLGWQLRLLDGHRSVREGPNTLDLESIGDLLPRSS